MSNENNPANADTADLGNGLAINELVAKYETSGKRQGTPVFTVEDLADVHSPFSKVVRLFFIQNNITKEYFKEVCVKYLEEHCTASERKNYWRNNFERSLKLENVSWNTLETLFLVFGIELLNVQVSYKTANGEIGQVTLKEAQKLTNEKQFVVNRSLLRETHTLAKAVQRNRDLMNSDQ